MSDTKLSAENAAGALSGSEFLPGIQGGANVKISANQLATLAAAKVISVQTGSPTTASDSSLGFSPGMTWFNSSTGDVWRCRDASLGAAVWVKMSTGDFYAYQPGRYYLPYGNGVAAGNTANSASTVYMHYGVIRERVTISQVGVRIATLSTGGNFQIAIYKANPLTGMPSTLIGSTASGSTTSAAIVNLALPVQLEPGGYWFAINQDNAVCNYLGLSNARMDFLSLIGSAFSAVAAGTGNTSQAIGFFIAQAFGTWPADWTGTNLGELGAGHTPQLHFLVGSVP